MSPQTLRRDRRRLAFSLGISLFTAFLAAAGTAPAAPRHGPAKIRARALPAVFDSDAALTAELTRDLRRVGPFDGAYAMDLDSGRTLFSYNADVARSPASTEKLYTTATALARFGPAGVLKTAVLGVGAPDPAGIWHGNLYLHGGGDPTFGSQTFIRRYYAGVGATVAALAAAVEGVGITKVDGSIVGDESMFDTRRGTPPSGYSFNSDIGSPLTALSFDRGRSSGGGPAAFAASQLAAALRSDGVAVTGPSIAGRAPANAAPIAQITSPTIRQIVALTLPESDNFFAETLLKDLGAYFGGAGSTAGGATVVRRWLAPLGIHPRISDGSGLDRADKTTPREEVRLLRAVRKTAIGDALKAALPVAGLSGTLLRRMRGTAAAGRCQAKTGTLSDVSALTGFCPTAGGDEVAFALLMNHQRNTLLARTEQDRIAASLAACGRPCAQGLTGSRAAGHAVH
jgi:D-alanyl-D-alanine carboxypeptidase/D-alanyl-D-alanine-endopeptidase (penicillin-binding protein 4)